ncbi:MAG: transposase [Cyclobacteriaceae bacterium]
MGSDGKTVKFLWKDYRDGRQKTMELSCGEFIRRFMQHNLSRASGYFPTAFTKYGITGFSPLPTAIRSWRSVSGFLTG